MKKLTDTDISTANNIQSEPCHISDVMRGLKSPNQQSTSLIRNKFIIECY